MIEFPACDFIALDVETANPDYSSICQIGLAFCRKGKIVGQWDTFVDPADYFSPYNTKIHGITASDVDGAPSFGELHASLSKQMQNAIVVCHSPFDRTAIAKASNRHGVSELSVRWLDSMRVAKRAWKERAKRGYGLAALADFLGIDFDHHNAAEDAKAAALVVLAAIKKTGLSAEDWLSRIEQPISGKRHRTASIPQPDDDGPLVGESVVFTGRLTRPRGEMGEIAAAAGCTIQSGKPTKTTTLLVVGDQDASVLAGHEKSSKHRKVEELIQKGQNIRIVDEATFFKLLGVNCVAEPETQGGVHPVRLRQIGTRIEMSIDFTSIDLTDDRMAAVVDVPRRQQENIAKQLIETCEGQEDVLIFELQLDDPVHDLVDLLEEISIHARDLLSRRIPWAQFVAHLFDTREQMQWGLDDLRQQNDSALIRAWTDRLEFLTSLAAPLTDSNFRR